MTERDHWVYRAYDTAGNCLYIGCTKDPQQRAQTHRSSSRWYYLMDSCVLAGPYTRTTALRIETEQIAAIQPAYNRRGVPAAVDAHPFAPSLSTSQTARFLGLNDERPLLRMVHEGAIKAYNVGSPMQPRFRFLKSDLEALTGREVA